VTFQNFLAWVPASRRVEILKSHLATLFTIYNDYRADFWEFLLRICTWRGWSLRARPEGLPLCVFHVQWEVEKQLIWQIHRWLSHVTRVHESCHSVFHIVWEVSMTNGYECTCDWVKSHIWWSRVTYDEVVSHTWAPLRVFISSGMFKSKLIWMRHVTLFMESWRTHE